MTRLARHAGREIEGIFTAAASERTEVIEGQDIAGGVQGAGIRGGNRPQAVQVLALQAVESRHRRLHPIDVREAAADAGLCTTETIDAR